MKISNFSTFFSMGFYWSCYQLLVICEVIFVKESISISEGTTIDVSEPFSIWISSPFIVNNDTAPMKLEGSPLACEKACGMKVHERFIV